jgi:hypothetical protein
VSTQVLQISETLTHASSDALKRHEQVHNEPKRSSLGRGERACLACATAKRKCSGGDSCLACQKRSIDCSYTHASKLQRSERGDSVSNGGSVTASHSDTISDDESSHYAERANTSIEESSSSTSHGHASPIMNANQQHPLTGTVQYSRRPQELLDNTNRLGSFMPNVRYNFGEQQSSSDSPQSVYHADQNYPKPGEPATFKANNLRGAENGRTLGSAETWPRPQDISLQVNNNTLPRTLGSVSGSDPRIWPQSNLSSINWLPDDWMPEFQIDIGDEAIVIPTDFPNSDQSTQSQVLNMANGPDTFQNNYSFPQPAFANRLGPSSPASQGTQKVGRFYVDGQGARLPHVSLFPSH